MRELIRKRILGKEASKTPTGFIPLQQIKAMMILMDANGRDKDECMARIRSFCRKNKIELTVMYVDFSKRNGDDETIALGDLGWFGMPSMKKAGYVLGKWFDILISMTDSDRFCVRYLAHAVDARMKIGAKAFPDDPYEITIVPHSCNDATATSPRKTSSISMNELFVTIENILIKIR